MFCNCIIFAFAIKRNFFVVVNVFKKNFKSLTQESAAVLHFRRLPRATPLTCFAIVLAMTISILLYKSATSRPA